VGSSVVHVSRNHVRDGVIKEYCAFHFWKGALIIENSASDQMWGQLGRLAKVSDLRRRRSSSATSRKAMELNEEGTKVPRRP
jgi:hypothetical protein